jgi:hypothetical protein
VVPYDQPAFAAVLIEIKDGKTPSKVFDERLVFKAGASLYDFIASSAVGATGPWDLPEVKVLLDKFSNYLRQTSFYWAGVLRGWVRENITDADCIRFLANFTETSLTYFSLHSWVPVVCVGGAIHSVECDSSGEPSAFDHCKGFSVGLRLQGWRTFAKWRMLRRSPEAPVIVTNVSGLREVLDGARAWFQEQKRQLLEASTQTKQRALLEAALVQQASLNFSRRETLGNYRSDLDVGYLFEDW